jgi:hypothetical protein
MLKAVARKFLATAFFVTSSPESRLSCHADVHTNRVCHRAACLQGIVLGACRLSHCQRTILSGYVMRPPLPPLLLTFSTITGYILQFFCAPCKSDLGPARMASMPPGSRTTMSPTHMHSARSAALHASQSSTSSLILQMP